MHPAISKTAMIQGLLVIAMLAIGASAPSELSKPIIGTIALVIGIGFVLLLYFAYVHEEAITLWRFPQRCTLRRNRFAFWLSIIFYVISGFIFVGIGAGSLFV